MAMTHICEECGERCYVTSWRWSQSGELVTHSMCHFAPARKITPPPFTTVLELPYSTDPPASAPPWEDVAKEAQR